MCVHVAVPAQPPYVVERPGRPALVERHEVVHLQIGRMLAPDAPPAVPDEGPAPEPPPLAPRQLTMIATHATCNLARRGAGILASAPAANANATATSSRPVALWGIPLGESRVALVIVDDRGSRQTRRQ